MNFSFSLFSSIQFNLLWTIFYFMKIKFTMWKARLDIFMTVYYIRDRIFPRDLEINTRHVSSNMSTDIVARGSEAFLLWDQPYHSNWLRSLLFLQTLKIENQAIGKTFLIGEMVIAPIWLLRLVPLKQF